MRALSDQWHFKRKSHSWSRKSEFWTELEDYDQLLSPPSHHLNPLLVSELRGSLTDLDRRVKTYSFLPGDDQLPSILIESTFDSSVSKTADESLEDDLYQSREWEMMDSFTIPRSGIDNFATGIIDTFESSMRKIVDVHRSQSLPDVFAASQRYGSTDDSPTSSVSVSTASIPDTSKNPSNLLNSSHSVHMNGHMANGELHRETNGARRKAINSRGSNVTLESSTGGSELGESERDQQDLSPQPQSSGRFSERSSTAEPPSFSDLSSPGVVFRPKKKDSMQRYVGVFKIDHISLCEQSYHFGIYFKSRSQTSGIVYRVSGNETCCIHLKSYRSVLLFKLAQQWYYVLYRTVFLCTHQGELTFSLYTNIAAVVQLFLQWIFIFSQVITNTWRRVLYSVSLTAHFSRNLFLKQKSL